MYTVKTTTHYYWPEVKERTSAQIGPGPVRVSGDVSASDVKVRTTMTWIMSDNHVNTWGASHQWHILPLIFPPWSKSFPLVFTAMTVIYTEADATGVWQTFTCLLDCSIFFSHTDFRGICCSKGSTFLICYEYNIIIHTWDVLIQGAHGIRPFFVCLPGVYKTTTAAKFTPGGNKQVTVWFTPGARSRQPV